MFKFVCPVCGKNAEKPLNYVNNNKKKSRGPYCSRSCAGKAGKVK